MCRRDSPEWMVLACRAIASQSNDACDWLRPRGAINDDPPEYCSRLLRSYGQYYCRHRYGVAYDRSEAKITKGPSLVYRPTVRAYNWFELQAKN